MKAGIQALIILLASNLSFNQPLKNLNFGKHNVGFRSFLLFDQSRPSRAKNEMGRAIQVNVWYPAKTGKSQPMTLKDYVSLISAEDSLSTSNASELSEKILFLELQNRGAAVNSWKTFLNSRQPLQREAAFTGPC